MKKKLLFVYRTKRYPPLKQWEKGYGPDSLLFGFNHLKKMGYDAEFFDTSYSLKNYYHPIFYPLEHMIMAKVGMGIKFDQAFHLLPKVNKYDVIVATGDSAGLALLSLKYHGLIKKPIIYMSAGLAGALRGKERSLIARYYKKILKVPDVFTSYSQIEIDFFEKRMGLPKGKIKYMPLGTDWNYFSKKAKKVKKNVICAVGVDTGRDYKTLFDAVEGMPIQVEIACHPSNIEGLKIPRNVQVHVNIPITQVKDIFDRSLISVVPCFERFRSAGQMVILESGSSGLPVIASKIKGITSAFNFKDNKDILYSEAENPKELKRKILYLLNNPKRAKELGDKISRSIKENYTTQKLAGRLSRYIDSL